MKRFLSILMVLVMVISMLPTQVFSSEAAGESTEIPVVTGEPAPSEAPVPEEELLSEDPIPEDVSPSEDPVPEDVPPSEDPIPEDELLSEDPNPDEEGSGEPAAERVCKDGCILVGEEEHLESGGECFVWIACGITEGCEGPEGHEGECYGASLYADEPLVIHYFLASPGNITNPNGSYVNYYGPNKSLTWWPESYAVSNIKQDASWNTIYSQQGIRNVYDESIVTKYVASWPTGSEATFKDFGSVTINGRSYSDTEYEIKWVSIMCRDNDHPSSGMRCNQRSFEGEHIHIDGLLVEKILPGEMEVFKAIPEAQNTATTFRFTLQKMRQPSLTAPPSSADAVDTSFAPMTLTASILAGKTEAQITGGSEISFGYYKLTEISNNDWQMDGIVLTERNGSTRKVDADALYICIAPDGTVQYSTAPSGPYTVMSHVAIQNERKPVTVTYQWHVYNTNGAFTSLPAGAPAEPASVANVKLGSRYVYDTEYVTGTSFYDYDNGLLYTFHGWDTYSHSAVYNPHPGVGYYALDDGDAVASNNPTIEITADTYIYGYWTVTELEPSSAHIAIEKVFIVDGVEMSMADAEDLWFHIDTGIDRDGDGETMVDVDYHMIAESTGGEYKIPVYQYDAPFVFTEHNADVPGYTRTTTVTVSGDHIVGYSQNGDSVTVTMDPVYQGTNIHLGMVTYTNTYTKNVGTPISVYPVLTLLKTAADTQHVQDGVGFALYRDEACTDLVATVTTANGGQVELNFADIDNAALGTYYLKETAPLAGYHADPSVYAVTLGASQTAEELRNGQYVQVTYYTLSVAVPEDSTATFTEGSNQLHIYNEPILGSLDLSKTISGMADADKSRLDAVVIVHGPITRDDAGNITGIGATWQMELNSENGWADSLEYLPLGEYLIHESFASVHGYTWIGVTYGNLETVVYNGITSGVFRVENETPISLTLTNTYEEWTAADFYIKKVDENGTALAGAVFSLSTDEAGTDVFTTRTTGADGYAYFSGYTVPEGQTSVTYYLRETKAPAGYYISDQIYKVVITAVTDPATGKVSFEPEITLVRGRNSGFDIATDLLIVTNFPVLGKLTITKAFDGGTIPQGLAGISVQISGPNGYNKVEELNNANGWAVTIENLHLGQYTITELDAKVPGYTWDVSYSSTTVTLTEENPGSTVPGTEISGNATITNSYTRNEEIYEIPTALTVKKVGEQGEALAGAVFTLDQLGADGTVVSSVSFTTGADGTVMFDLLAGFVQEGQAIDGTYIISETKAPAGYEPTDATWTVTIREDDGQIRWTLNENKNIFEGFWDWIVGNVSAGTFENGVLTVQNVRSRGSLTVQKNVNDPVGMYTNAVYSFTLDASDDTFDKSFTLKAGESITIRDIPWGTTYTLTEDTTGAAFTAAITDAGNGRVWAYETRIDVTNTYAYTTHNNPLSLVKVDADDNTKVISGAGFTLYADATLTTKVGAEVFSDANGCLALPIAAAGTYYLAETTTPAGYHPNATVYTVTAEEKEVVLNAGTAEAVTQIQMHIRITGLTGTTTNQIDYTYLIENTAIKTLEVNVEKVWADAEGASHPESVEAVLYRDGQEYAAVVLSEENNWSHTWTGLTDEYTWSVDEKNVPAGYTKKVTSQGYDFIITNTSIRNEEIYEIPTALTVKKVGEQGEALAGAVFTLDQLGADGTVVSSVSFTTGADGTVMFDLLAGFVQEGQAIDGTYIISETKAPAGYESTDATWTVTIREDDGQIRWTLNENKNIFEGFWDWIVGNVSAGTFENGVLTVQNVRSRGSLTVQKNVNDPVGMYANAVYSFTLDASDDTFDKSFTLKAGESITIRDIPWGTTYTLTEDTTGAAFTAAITDAGNGRVWSYETRIDVTNTYAYTIHNNPLSLVKVDADDNTKVISGAGFTLYADATLTTKVGAEVFSDANGCLALPIAAAGTYYLAETTTPAGYHPNAAVYTVTAEEKEVVLNAGTAEAVTQIQMHTRITGLTGTTTNQIDYTYLIENTAIKTLEVNVEKIWEDEGYYGRPEAIEVTLYRDNEPFDTVTLNQENDWRYSWTGLTDEYTWSVDEAEISAEYVKTITNDGNDWTITNTRTPNPVEITVTKAWNHNGGKNLPESIAATLFKDGEAYDTVTLNEENNWTHTWTGLTDAYQWSVDETDVPAGYTKEITVEGYEFMITNTRTINHVEVSVTKVWEASEGVIHPESVEAVLYRDGEEFDTVVLGAENDWSHTWTGLTDEYTWSVDEKNVPEGYIKNVTGEGYDFTITNTRAFTYIDISVNKIWYGAGIDHPDSVSITLFRDGEAYHTVTLSANNNWTHTWESLTDEYTWTVDETSVPSGYTKRVYRDGNNFTVVNTHVDNPKTGDFTNLLGMGTMAAIGIMGFGFCLLALLAPRRKEEET